MNNYGEIYKELKKQLKEVQVERKAIINKVNNGGKLTKAEEKNIKTLALKEVEITSKLAKFDKVHSINKIKDAIAALVAGTISADMLLNSTKADVKRVGIDNAEFESDMRLLGITPANNKRTNIVNKYNKKLDNISYIILQDLANENLLEDEVVEKKDAPKKAEKTTSTIKKEKTVNKTKEKKGNAGQVVTTAMLTAALLAGGHFLAKGIKNNNVDASIFKNNDSKKKIEDVVVESFETKYINAYKEDYEFTMAKYSIREDQAISLVNRAHKIQELNFFEDATIDQIVEVLFAIDSRDLFLQDNANLAQLFNTSFNRVTDNYLFGKTTEDDFNKIEAIKYMAKEGTDMDKFLEQYSTLLKSILENPENDENRNKMLSHVEIFATSLNGFTNRDDLLTSDTTFNENAQVNDYYNYFIAYNSFIAPLYPVMAPTSVESADFQKYYDLQLTMLSAFEAPEFKDICGSSLKLGGE